MVNLIYIQSSKKMIDMYIFVFTFSIYLSIYMMILKAVVSDGMEGIILRDVLSTTV